MAFPKEELEYYHNKGLMPDWAYYQQNGESAQSNYIRQRNKFQNSILGKRQKVFLDKELEKKLEESLEKELDKILDKLLKDFNN